MLGIEQPVSKLAIEHEQTRKLRGEKAVEGRARVMSAHDTAAARRRRAITRVTFIEVQRDLECRAPFVDKQLREELPLRAGFSRAPKGTNAIRRPLGRAAIERGGQKLK